MLSPCLFVVLLAIGYFFIDKKTQTELISKCKKNKFIILGGIVFIYYFFLRNGVEGLTPDKYTLQQYNGFIGKLCYEQSGMTKKSLENLNEHLDDDYKLSETNQTDCLLDGIRNRDQVDDHLSIAGPSSGGEVYLTEEGPSSATQQGAAIDLAGSIQVAGNPVAVP